MSQSQANSLSYQQVSQEENHGNQHHDDQDDHEELSSSSSPSIVVGIDPSGAKRTLWNFIFMSVLFSANHGCVVACLSLATTRFGSTGAWTSGILYLTYTASAVLGATYVVKQLGARNALMAGMGLYCFYVGCFWLATYALSLVTIATMFGSAIGGVGAGFLWTAQGSYFSRASEDHAGHMGQDVSESNATLASIFAFLYLAEEVALRALSTFLLDSGWSWSVVFGSYTAVTVLSATCMIFVYDYPMEASIVQSTTTTSSSSSSVWFKVTAAWRILRNDPKMKYMIGLNAVFGFTSAFLNSYINGEVVRVATHDEKAKSVGIFNAWVSCVAAAMSLAFGRVTKKLGNGPVLILGALCFFGVVFPFVILPDTSRWTVPLLVLVYTFHGTGRATFEGTLKATFANYFSYEKEGAFANIILQNGLSGAIGYALTFKLLCSEESRYCIPFKSDGHLHDVLSFELLVIFTAAMAIFGYLRASAIHRFESNSVEEATRDAENGATPLSATTNGQ